MIETIKDLEKLLKVCRKYGVTQITHNGTSLHLGEAPVVGATSQLPSDSSDPYANFPSGELTPEQLMFYSAGGMPENDPVNNKVG